MTESQIPDDEQPDFDAMTVADWKTYLRDHPDRCLVINAQDGVHTVQYDPDDEKVTFWAYGSQGYNAAGTDAVLELIAEQSDGLRVQTREETYDAEINRAGEQGKTV